MNAYLVGAACLQLEGDKAVPIFFIDNFIVCHGIFSIFKINDSLDDGTGFSG